MYNLTDFGNAKDISDLVVYSNNLTDGVLISFLLVGIFLIMVFALKKYDFDDGLLVSAWAMFFLSAILSYGKYVNIIFPLGFLAIAAFAGLYVYMTKNN
jgi:hypothetical protein